MPENDVSNTDRAETNDAVHPNREPSDTNRSAAHPDDPGRDERDRTVLVYQRRSFLKTLPLPPIVAALAGCQSDDLGIDLSDVPTATENEPGGGIRFGDVIQIGEAYHAQVVMRGGNGSTIRMAGRFYGEDYYLRIERDGAVSEAYLVDDDRYVDVNGQCSQYPDVRVASQDASASDGRAGGIETSPQLTRAGSTTIDGREMLVFELLEDTFGGYGDQLTYYVDPESGYLRRLEAGSITVDYYFRREVEPIVAPDMDCRQPAAPLPRGSRGQNETDDAPGEADIPTE